MTGMPVKILLTQIECIRESHESGADEVYLEIYVDDKWYGRFYGDNPIKMHSHDHRYADIEIEASYGQKIHINIRDRDGSLNSTDNLADIYLDRNIPLEGSRSAHQETGYQQAEYGISWRVLYKPIPTVRILGVKCEKSSCNCNRDLLDAVTTVASEIMSRAGEAIGKSPRPSRKLIAKGFDVASEIIGNSAAIIAWIADVAEGKDDVYMQHIFEDDPNDGGGGFFPEAGKNYKMDDGDQVFFEDEFGEYFRFPLDRGPVTIQLREHDSWKPDISMGSITINMDDYERLKDDGAQVVLADEYFRYQQGGQGALYHICYSVGLEDWSKAATSDAQGEIVEPDTLPEEGIWYSIVNRYNNKVLLVAAHNMQNNGKIVQCKKISQYEDQRWQVNYCGSNKAWIQNQMSQKVICVQGSDNKNQAVQMTRWDYDDQKWRFEDAGDGWMYIVNSSSGKVLSNLGQMNDFDLIVQDTKKEGYLKQMWKFEDADSSE